MFTRFEHFFFSFFFVLFFASRCVNVSRVFLFFSLLFTSRRIYMSRMFLFFFCSLPRDAYSICVWSFFFFFFLCSLPREVKMCLECFFFFLVLYLEMHICVSSFFHFFGCSLPQDAFSCLECFFFSFCSLPRDAYARLDFFFFFFFVVPYLETHLCVSNVSFLSFSFHFTTTSCTGPETCVSGPNTNTMHVLFLVYVHMHALTAGILNKYTLS